MSTDYIQYKFDDGGRIRNIKIPKSYIVVQQRALGITEQEAIDLFLSDEGYVIDPTVEELTNKAKSAGVGANARSTTLKKRKAPERKPQYDKRLVIQLLQEALEECWMDDYLPYTKEDGKQIKIPAPNNVIVTNPERMIAFAMGDERYEITLTRKRKPKK